MEFDFPLKKQCVSCTFIATLKALHCYAKKSILENKCHPLPHLFEIVIPNQRLFSSCQSCRHSTSRSAKVESEVCSRCKQPLPRFFVALEMCITLQSPLFHYYKWADQQQHTEIAQPYICQKKVNGADCDVHRSDNDIKLNNEFYGRKRLRRWGKGGFGEGCVKSPVVCKLCREFAASPEARFFLLAVLLLLLLLQSLST